MIDSQGVLVTIRLKLLRYEQQKADWTNIIAIKQDRYKDFITERIKSFIKAIID